MMNPVEFDVARAQHARRVNDPFVAHRRAARDRRKTRRRRPRLRWW
jgi:hypothetical protein